MEQPAVFFDIGDTLAAAVVEDGKLARLDAFRFVPEVLAELRHATTAIGLISNTGSETRAHLEQLLTESGLLPLVDAHLCLFSSVEGLDKSQPEFFTLASDRAGLPASRCLFVGEDARERAVAASVGFGVSPHPLHALHVVGSTPQP
jgi:FMN phosphatase YigB (HAD superfamily)